LSHATHTVFILYSCYSYGTDRDFLGLPGAQAQLFDQIAAAAEALGLPVVVVLSHGGPISIDMIKAAPNAAVIDSFFPGQAGGQAIAETLFGVTNPSAKLTVTIYPKAYANGEPMRGKPWMDSQVSTV
jgi:beta-glucosidase